MQKIALGTVQFGLNYGVANQRGQTPKAEVRQIIAAAFQAGINTLDTAIAYGESESILGEIGIKDWTVVTKFPSLLNHLDDLEGVINQQLSSSLSKLGISQVDAVLLHKPLELLDDVRGTQIKSALLNLKNKGLVKKVGVSVYSPNELELIFQVFVPDLVQLPFNPIDRRFQKTGWLKRLKEQNIEVHARSIFLQGLLLMDPKNRPGYFAHWHSLWDQWHDWFHKEGLNPLAACLQFALSETMIDRVIVGVDDLAQLTEILNSSLQKVPEIPAVISCNDPNLVNPTLWRLN